MATIMCVSQISRKLVELTLKTSRQLGNSSHIRLLSTTATETESKNGSSAPTDNTEAVEKLQAQLESIQAEHKEHNANLQKKLSDFEDKYKRSLAETENVRQRLKKQIDDAKLFGIQGFCKDLLEVADILSKATESVPKEDLKTNPQLQNLYEGLTMTETQLGKVFTKNGLVVINPPEGEKFNPNIHEALFQAPIHEGATGGTVAQVTKIGYKLHDRTIRPALVGVYKG